MKDLDFLYDSLDKLCEMPDEVQGTVGYNLDLVQRGLDPADFGPLSGVGRGVMEIRASHDKETYRAVYIAKFAERVYVLDIIHKKSKHGKALPKKDMSRLARRYKELRQMRRENGFE